MDDRPNPLEERPFAHELGDALRTAVRHVRAEEPPAASLSRALERARRFGPGTVNPWLRYHRAATAVAAAAVLMLTLGLLLICAHFEPAPPQVASPGDRSSSPDAGDQGTEIDVNVGVDHGPGRMHGDADAGPARPGDDGRLAENPFVDAERNPVSTLPLTVDTASYRDVRRALLEEKRLPAADSVRVGELVNAFSYSYPKPTQADPVSLTLDLAECPWNAAHHLARVGLSGRAGAAGVQVAFHPLRVAAYRLIGYEGRRGRRADAVSGESLSGAVTALYELAPNPKADDAEWLTVKMRYRDAGDAERLLTRSLSGPAAHFAEAPADFRFAAAAAEFGLLLRDSEYKGRAAYAAVRAAARDALGADPDGRRAEFLALVDAADRLTSERKLTRQDQLVRDPRFSLN